MNFLRRVFQKMMSVSVWHYYWKANNTKQKPDILNICRLLPRGSPAAGLCTVQCASGSSSIIFGFAVDEFFSAADKSHKGRPMTLPVGWRGGVPRMNTGLPTRPFMALSSNTPNTLQEVLMTLGCLKRDHLLILLLSLSLCLPPLWVVSHANVMFLWL